MKKKHVFAFWEPSQNLPAYLALCMKTWEKFLPEYEIHLLDFKTINQWLSEDEIKQFTCPAKCSLAMQADIYRGLLLLKHGGLWLDCDTIITSPKAAKFLESTQSDFALFGSKDRKHTHAACLYAKKPHVKIVESWVQQLAETIPAIKMRYGNFMKYIAYRILEKLKRIKRVYWGSAFNGIVDKLVSNCDERTATVWDRSAPDINVFPEHELTEIDSEIDKYVQFWFSSGELPDDFIEKSCGIILLHNGWTPKQYRSMSESEFLAQDIRMASFLKKIL